MNAPKAPADGSWALVIAGGGTGGHLFPAIAIVEALRATSRPPAEICWLCSDRAIDAQVLEAHDLAFTPLAARPFSLRPLGIAKFMAGWGPSVRRSRQVIRGVRAQHQRVVMLSTGGFVAAPAAQAARVERCPIHAVVLDDPPGKATRWISTKAHAVHDATLGGTFSAEHSVGPIVRKDAMAPTDAAGCKAHWGLDPDRPVLLITGGSLGASTLNAFAEAFVRAHSDTLKSHGWQILHQTGQQSGPDLAGLYRELDLTARIEPMLSPMGAAWGAADLALCRAGAGTVAEAAVHGVPAAFMPYPFHRDQHQRTNALPIVEAGAALLFEDLRQAAANLGAHSQALLTLLTEQDARQAMRAKAAKAFGQPGERGAVAVASALVTTALDAQA